MMLWKLIALRVERGKYDSWPSYCDSDGFVVRAESEHAAREIAAQYVREEACDDEAAYWLSPFTSTCEAIDADGESGVILESNIGA